MTASDSQHTGTLQQDKAFFPMAKTVLSFPKQCHCSSLNCIHGEEWKKKNLSNFNFCNTKIKRFGITRSSFQLGQIGGRSGQAIIIEEAKGAQLDPGSCKFHNCRDINTCRTGHQDLVRGASAPVFLLTRKKHAVLK